MSGSHFETNKQRSRFDFQITFDFPILDDKKKDECGS